MPAFDMARSNGQDVVQHAWLDFVREIYPKFLVSDDFDYQDEEDKFYQRLEDSRRQQLERNKALKDEKDALEQELAELEATPDPLLSVEDSLRKLDSDRVKCVTFITKLKDHCQAAKMALQAAQDKKAVNGA